MIIQFETCFNQANSNLSDVTKIILPIAVGCIPLSKDHFFRNDQTGSKEKQQRLMLFLLPLQNKSKLIN